MLLSDLMSLPIVALGQQKLRTTLTTLGVIFGAFVLAASLSIGEGVQETIDRESRRQDIARRVEISPRWNMGPDATDLEAVTVAGTHSDARRTRIRQALAEMHRRNRPAPPRTELTTERLNRIAALPHVQQLIPLVYEQAHVVLGTASEPSQIVSVRPDDETCRRRIVAGRFFESPNERSVVISEFLAYRLGLVNDADIDTLVGKPLTLKFPAQPRASRAGIPVANAQPTISPAQRAAIAQVMSGLPQALERLGLEKAKSAALRRALQRSAESQSGVFSEEFPVAGVIRYSTEEERKGPHDSLRVDSDLFLPYETALEVHFRDAGPNEGGVNHAVALVDSELNVKQVVEQVAGLGLESRAAVEFIDRERLIYLLIFGGMTCVAAVALLVSALGIANTMLMSVLERTREIGIMKAVGADNRHLVWIFLVEGALIGFWGGVVGLLLAWAASFPGDAWVHDMVRRDIKIDLSGPIFVLPPWMAATVLAFTVLVTTLAAVYPARHAARIDPVSALRHE